MNIEEVKSLLNQRIREENEKYFGFTDDAQIDLITNNWFNDNENYDGRWKRISNRLHAVGKVLDMAAGCGTFVLNGLQSGYDVYGVEPEGWKREYFQKKIVASNYPRHWGERVIYGVGEVLPFSNESFDLITTYQTLEHVQDVNVCIKEMLRVLKYGGVLYIRAPDYNCFFEPHYRVPFLPRMNKELAGRYLKYIGRPSLGLETLNWTTEKNVVHCLNNSGYKLNIKRAGQFNSERREAKLKKLLPSPLRRPILVKFIIKIYGIKLWLRDISMVGRREKNIYLWVTKIG